MKRACFTFSPTYCRIPTGSRTAAMLRDVREVTNRRYTHTLLPRLFWHAGG